MGLTGFLFQLYFLNILVRFLHHFILLCYVVETLPKCDVAAKREHLYEVCIYFFCYQLAVTVNFLFDVQNMGCYFSCMSIICMKLYYRVVYDHSVDFLSNLTLHLYINRCMHLHCLTAKSSRLLFR